MVLFAECARVVHDCREFFDAIETDLLHTLHDKQFSIISQKFLNKTQLAPEKCETNDTPDNFRC